jgi:hypothetical protein
VPFLRFLRDRRGYESTYLLHSSKRRGDAPSQLLYWFRTPPHVKIGRAAFDEDAIRLLEEQHPDVEFDWDNILTAKAPAAPEVRDPRDSRGKRPERRREPRAVEPRAPRQVPPRPERAIVPPAAPAEAIVEPTAASEENAPPSFMPAATTAAAAVPEEVLAAPPVEESAPVRRFVRVFDAPVPPDHRAMDPAVVERLVGPEQLTVLRARYSEILARITARGGDPARVEALREQAERVNPDAWVTEADVTVGLAGLEATLAGLHKIVGRRRRRRRRRTGGSRPIRAELSDAAIVVPGAAADSATDDLPDDDLDDEREE